MMIPFKSLRGLCVECYSQYPNLKNTLIAYLNHKKYQNLEKQPT
jgi:hypothetical protein